MKMAYIYQEGKNISKANIYQSCSMAVALSKHRDISWYRGFIRFKDLKEKPSLKQKRVINLGGFSTNIAILEKLSRLVFCLNSLMLLLLSNPDVIYTRDFAFIYFYSKLPSWLKVKAKIVYESHKIMSQVSSKVSKTQEIAAYSAVDQFVTVSEGIKKDLISSFAIDSKSIIVLPNGFDPSLFPKNENRSKRQKASQFIYAGSFEKWKGVETIAEAIKLPTASSRQIHIAGGSKSQFTNLSVKIKEDNLIDKVTLYPSMTREQLFEFYSEMDVGLVTTIALQEGAKYTSPVKFFEYVNAGLLVLSSDIEPMRELSRKGFYIEFYKVGSSSSLSEALDKICKNGIDYEKILKNKRMLQDYTWDERAKKIVAFLS